MHHFYHPCQPLVPPNPHLTPALSQRSCGAGLVLQKPQTDPMVESTPRQEDEPRRHHSPSPAQRRLRQPALLPSVRRLRHQWRTPRPILSTCACAQPRQKGSATTASHTALTSAHPRRPPKQKRGIGSILPISPSSCDSLRAPCAALRRRPAEELAHFSSGFGGRDGAVVSTRPF